MARVRRGDRDAYRLVVEACEAPLRLVVAAIVPDREVIEDVVQEAFVTAYTKLGDYRAGSNLLAWLKAIARNLALNERRRWRRERRHRDDRDVRALETVDAAIADLASSAGSETLEALQRCVERLGGSARAVVEAFYWTGSPVERIAGDLERPATWVRVVLHRARAALADCLARGAGGTRDGR